MGRVPNIVDGAVRTSLDHLDQNFPKWRKDFEIMPRFSKDIFKMYSIDEETGEVRLPRSAIGLVSEYGFEDLRVSGTKKEFTSRFNAREGQEGVVSKSCSELDSTGGSILEAGCGRGKTVMGCEIALRRGVPTCVMVHADFLARQFEEAMTMLCPEVKIGHVRSDTCDTGLTHDLVLASTQSITNPNREYPEEFYRSFGLTISDEVHRYGAAVWQTALSKFHAQERLGLTATTDRSDGLWDVVVNNIGPVGAILEGTNLLPREVYMIKISTQIDEKQFDKPWLTRLMIMAKLISILAEHPGRNKILASLVMKAYQSKRRLIFFSDRKVQLELVSEEIMRQGVKEEDIGFYVGGMKPGKLDAASKKPVIFSTYKMGMEALNIPELDSLIMGTPRARVTQMIGRILRKAECAEGTKRRPVVVDPCDVNIELLAGAMYSRLREYSKSGYPVTKTF